MAALGRATWADGKETPAAKDLQTFSRTSWALGSDVTLTVLHTQKDVAERALSAAFTELNEIEDVLSIYRPHSQLSKLNKAGFLDAPHAHLTTVLNAGQELAQKTGGAFDMTVQPLWELYFEAKNRKTLPDDKAIAAARAKIDYRGVSMTAKRIEFKAPVNSLTFNGIGQGYAADRVLSVLKANGIEHALIDTGEFTSEGRKADGNAFRVGIQHPREPDAFVGICKMDGRALATSGDYATYFSDDFLYHHIFDPATGRSPLELASVSIVAPTAMLADALTKPVFILGKQKGLALVESMKDCDAFVVTKDGKTAMTKGFPLV